MLLFSCCLCGLLILFPVAFSPTFSFSLSTQEFQDVANSDSRQKVPLFHSSTISNDLKAASPTSSLEVHDKLDRGKIRSATRCLRFLSMAKPKKCFKNLMRVSISLKGQLTNISFSCSLKLWRGQSGISFRSNFACLWTKQCDMASRKRYDFLVCEAMMKAKIRRIMSGIVIVFLS